VHGNLPNWQLQSIEHLTLRPQRWRADSEPSAAHLASYGLISNLLTINIDYLPLVAEVRHVILILVSNFLCRSFFPPEVLLKVVPQSAFIFLFISHFWNMKR